MEHSTAIQKKQFLTESIISIVLLELTVLVCFVPVFPSQSLRDGVFGLLIALYVISVLFFRRGKSTGKWFRGKKPNTTGYLCISLGSMAYLFVFFTLYQNPQYTWLAVCIFQVALFLWIILEYRYNFKDSASPEQDESA